MLLSVDGRLNIMCGYYYRERARESALVLLLYLSVWSIALKMNMLLSVSLNHDAPVSYYFQYTWMGVIYLVASHSRLVFSGKPASYADYFSLNGTTAELLLLRPISREQQQRFDLIIKVIITKMESFENACGAGLLYLANRMLLFYFNYSSFSFHASWRNNTEQFVYVWNVIYDTIEVR